LRDFRIGSDFFKKSLFERTSLPEFVERRLFDKPAFGDDADVRA
jgi:hypothetical protein